MVETKKRILVAEDNNVLADVMRFNLERAGYDVTNARDGGTAIGFLERESFDLLITDYQMPDVDGAALCQFVRQTLRLSDLSVIMCSAKGLELNMEQLRDEWKIAKLIYKPFSIRELVVTVRALVADTNLTNVS